MKLLELEWDNSCRLPPGYRETPRVVPPATAINRATQRRRRGGLKAPLEARASECSTGARHRASQILIGSGSREALRFKTRTVASHWAGVTSAETSAETRNVTFETGVVMRSLAALKGTRSPHASPSRPVRTQGVPEPHPAPAPLGAVAGREEMRNDTVTRAPPPAPSRSPNLSPEPHTSRPYRAAPAAEAARRTMAAEIVVDMPRRTR